MDAASSIPQGGNLFWEQVLGRRDGQEIGCWKWVLFSCLSTFMLALLWGWDRRCPNYCSDADVMTRICHRMDLDVRLQTGWFGKLSRRKVSAHTKPWCSQFVVPMKTKLSNSESSPYVLFLYLAPGWFGVAYLEPARLPSLSLQYNKQVVSACGSRAYLLPLCLSK